MFCSLTILVPLVVLVILQLTLQPVHSKLSLANFNEHFSNAYQQARTHLLSTVDPLIIVNDGVTLIHRGERTSVQVIPDVYEDLKAISHIPFTIYLLLFNVKSDHNNISSNKIAELKTYLEDIRTIRKSLNFSHSTDDVLQTQFNIIDLSINYLRSILKYKYLNETELKEFCLKSRTLFQLNLNQAARIRVDSLHSVIYPWYTKLFNETERQTMKVIITGPPSLRNGYLVTFYFEALLGIGNEQHKSNPVLYVENIYDEPRIITSLGSRLIDDYAGEAFYDDPSRLQYDLMLEETIVYLKYLFPSKNT